MRAIWDHLIETSLTISTLFAGAVLHRILKRKLADRHEYRKEDQHAQGGYIHHHEHGGEEHLMRPIVTLVLVAGLLAACGDLQTPATTETNATRATATTQIPASTAPSDRSTTRPAFGLLASLPVDVSAVLTAGPLLFDSRTFTGFGMPKLDNPDEVSPQWEFAAPPGTPALAPVTGYVVAIETLWSDDFTIWISADGGHVWVWELEHVVEVRVEIGDFVEAGQPIATASVFGGRNIALVELGVLKGGQVPVHYCPLLYVDEYALPTINEGLAAIRQENFERLNSQGLVSDPENDPYGQACWTDLPVSEES